MPIYQNSLYIYNVLPLIYTLEFVCNLTGYNCDYAQEYRLLLKLKSGSILYDSSGEEYLNFSCHTPTAICSKQFPNNGIML